MMLQRPMIGLGRPQFPIQQPMGQSMVQPVVMQQQVPQVQQGQMPFGLHPALLAQLQQMQGLGGYGQQPQMGLGRPNMGIQPLSPASAYSFR